MGEDIFRSIVCGGFCAFHKPGREDPLMCGTLAFLSRNLTARELARAARKAGPKRGRSSDAGIMALACLRCDFLEEGCGFREGLRGSPPCGGYAVLESLLKPVGPARRRGRTRRA